MADDFVQVQLDSTGKKVDTESLTVGANSVHRQRLQVSGTAADDVAAVTDAAPSASDHGLVARTISATTSTAPGITNVALSATSVTILASNTSRRMATFQNDGDQDLLLKLGTTATSTSYTIRIAPGGFYELPRPVYTGQIDGIWAAAGSGDCIITEIT